MIKFIDDNRNKKDGGRQSVTPLPLLPPPEVGARTPTFLLPKLWCGRFSTGWHYHYSAIFGPIESGLHEHKTAVPAA